MFSQVDGSEVVKIVPTHKGITIGDTQHDKNIYRLWSKEELKNESAYPLKLLFCNNCKLVQTDSVINPDILFRDYRYMSSVGLSKHFTQVANILNNRYNILGKDILEIAVSARCNTLTNGFSPVLILIP